MYKRTLFAKLKKNTDLYDETFNNSFREMHGLIEFNAALAIIGTIRGRYREKFIKKNVLNPTATTMLQETLLLFQSNKKPISKIPF